MALNGLGHNFFLEIIVANKKESLFIHSSPFEKPYLLTLFLKNIIIASLGDRNKTIFFKLSNKQLMFEIKD